MITRNLTKTINGAKAVINTLKQLGVDTIFGYPGGIVLDIYDELYKDNSIKHILTRHEQSAVHAAEGYARETGKCGVVLVTSGPGATNTISGIVNAYLDGYPLVVITGQVFKELLNKDSFQEANICDMTKSCTKATFKIMSASDIQDTLVKAYDIATSGKKGPVVVDMVKDIFKEDVEFEISSHNISTKNTTANIDIEPLISELRKAKRPIIVSGGGVKHSDAEDELLNLVSKTNIPVVCTMMGLGTFPQDNENYFGMIGIFGDISANKLLEKSDLVIGLGARFNDRITSRDTLNGKLFQIDINSNEISRAIPTDKYLIADIKEVIENVTTDKNFNIWNKNAQELKKSNIKREKTTNQMHSFEVMQELEEFTKDQNITFTSEVGQHQLWAVQNLHFTKDRKILVSGGSGTMGFGLPAAIGAAIGNKSKQIVCITGDGSFQMSFHELATCKDYDLNIKIMILNNGYLGMVRQLQEINCEGRYSQTKISNPDFVTLAKSYGIDGIRVTNINEAKSAMKKAFATNKTFIIDFVVESMEVL